MSERMDLVKEAASCRPNYLAQLVAEDEKLRRGMSGMTVNASNGDFTPRAQQQQQQQDQGPLEVDGKWTPRYLAILSGKPQSLSIHPDSHMNRIAQRAVKKFEKLRAVAGDDVAMLVARQPEVVMLIEREEAKHSDGTTLKYTIASCAQSAAAVLLELEEAAAMSHLFTH